MFHYLIIKALAQGLRNKLLLHIVSSFYEILKYLSSKSGRKRKYLEEFNMASHFSLILSLPNYLTSSSRNDDELSLINLGVNNNYDWSVITICSCKGFDCKNPSTWFWFKGCILRQVCIEGIYQECIKDCNMGCIKGIPFFVLELHLPRRHFAPFPMGQIETLLLLGQTWVEKDVSMATFC